MSKKKICNLVIVDASGSMRNKEVEVRGELRRLFTEIRNDKEVKHTTILCDFSSHGDCNITVRKRKTLVDELADEYHVRGMTALYDAIGLSFQKVEGEYDGVFVSIITDGLENASREFSLEDVKSLMDEKRKAGWGIVFSGTTEKALEGARKMGVAESNMVQYSDSAKGMKGSSDVRLRSREFYMKNVQMSAMMADVENENLVDDED